MFNLIYLLRRNLCMVFRPVVFLVMIMITNVLNIRKNLMKNQMLKWVNQGGGGTL
jgi:hypothetical protein